MTITLLTETTPAPAAQVDDPARELRSSHSKALRERDRLQMRADQLEERLDEIKDHHRYELAIRCEVRGCKSVCAVSSSSPPADRLLARALIMAVATLRWRLGVETIDQLRALAGSAGLNPGADIDTCPNHDTPTPTT